MGEEDIVNKAKRILAEEPLCDRCLGRMFARLGYGWSNRERGEAIKRLMVMELHQRIREGDSSALEEFKLLAPRIGPIAAPLYKRLFGEELIVDECIICGNRLDEFISQAAETGVKLLKSHEIERFVVGVRIPRSILEREDKLKRKYSLEYGESIKSEIRREVGKLIQSLSRGEMRADFEEPEATLLIEYPSGAMWLQVNSILYRGRYWKKGRLISQAYWPTPSGPKYYSIEEALWGLLRLHGGDHLVLHAAGREDVDARMLGTGRPMIVEIKSPRKRRIPLEEAQRAANANSSLVEVELEGYASRKDIQLYKEGVARTVKVYKALVLLDSPISREKLEFLEREFRDRTILQRTPKRVLHRRPDILRRRKVHSVSCHQLARNIIECVVEGEGGLYIKELVSCDGGRTTPCFGEVLGVNAVCVELDVIGVSHDTV